MTATKIKITSKHMHTEPITATFRHILWVSYFNPHIIYLIEFYAGLNINSCPTARGNQNSAKCLVGQPECSYMVARPGNHVYPGLKNTVCTFSDIFRLLNVLRQNWNFCVSHFPFILSKNPSIERWLVLWLPLELNNKLGGNYKSFSKSSQNSA